VRKSLSRETTEKLRRNWLNCNILQHTTATMASTSPKTEMIQTDEVEKKVSDVKISPEKVGSPSKEMTDATSRDNGFVLNGGVEVQSHTTNILVGESAETAGAEQEPSDNNTGSGEKTEESEASREHETGSGSGVGEGTKPHDGCEQQEEKGVEGESEKGSTVCIGSGDGNESETAAVVDVEQKVDLIELDAKSPPKSSCAAI